METDTTYTWMAQSTFLKTGFVRCIHKIIIMYCIGIVQN